VLVPRFAGLAPRSSVAFSRLLGSVTPDPGFKCFIRYPTAWWKATGVCQGHSLTDLPIRQCFYWTESQQQQCGTERGEALLMVYSTTPNVAFGEGSARATRKPRRSPLAHVPFDRILRTTMPGCAKTGSLIERQRSWLRKCIGRS